MEKMGHSTIIKMGKLKKYPTACIYNIKAPCLIFILKSGGITEGTFVKILGNFDGMELLPRLDCLIPLLIIDGHQSRLDSKFVENINEIGHFWKVCLGVPYTMSSWWVRDVLQQNRNFKSQMNGEKNPLHSNHAKLEKSY